MPTHSTTFINSEPIVDLMLSLKSASGYKYVLHMFCMAHMRLGMCEVAYSYVNIVQICETWTKHVGVIMAHINHTINHYITPNDVFRNNHFT